MSRIVSYNERLIDLDRITNPKLNSLTRERKFLFFFYTDRGKKFDPDTGIYEDYNYEQHSDDSRHTDSGHTDGPEHTDETNRTYGDYSERIGHTDYMNEREETRSEHTDRTKHCDLHTDHRESTYNDSIY